MPTASRRSSGILQAHGVTLPLELSAVRRFSMACPALPTCGLAVAESERAIPGILDQFEAELDRLGLRDVPLTVRMTGCPNGCARPYTADLAFVGPLAGAVQRVRGRRPGRRPAGGPLPGRRSDRGAAVRGAAAAGALGGGAERGRRSGRLLPADSSRVRARATTVTGREQPTIDLVPLRGGPVTPSTGSRRARVPARSRRQRAGAPARRSGAGHRLFDEVAVAFHQGEPGFDTVLDELAADEVTVVPVLTSAGHYGDVVLPEALARNRRFAEVRLRQTPPVGTHAGIAALVAGG